MSSPLITSPYSRGEQFQDGKNGGAVRMSKESDRIGPKYMQTSAEALKQLKAVLEKKNECSGEDRSNNSGKMSTVAKLWSYDCRKRLDVIFLNECGVIYEHRLPERFTVGKELLMEMVFGSVALNCSPSSPVSKMHELSKDLIMISSVFGVRSCNGNGTKNKLALVIIFDTSPDTYIREFIYNHIHLIDCFMLNLRNDFMDAIMRDSSSLAVEATNRFYASLNNVLSAQILSTNISLQDYVKELITLIRQIDTKGSHFFLSTLLSAILIYKKCANNRFQVVVTSESKRELMSRLLIILTYFVNGSSKWENVFNEPEINIKHTSTGSSSINKCAGNNKVEVEVQRNGNSNVMEIQETQIFSSPQNESKSEVNDNQKDMVRKSRDESLGYGSLTESGSSHEINVCGVDAVDYGNMVEGNTSHEVEDANADMLDQSRLYIKEYQSLRFDEINNDEEMKSGQSGGEKKRIIDSCASSGFGDDEECVDSESSLLPAKCLNVLGETPYPKISHLRSCIINDLTGEPVIGSKYLSHFKLQGIVINSSNGNGKWSSSALLDKMIKKCGCAQNTKLVLHADLDSWNIRISSLMPNSDIPGEMANWISQMCESLQILDSIDMNPQFIFEYMESKLRELHRKGQIYRTYNVNNHCIWSDTISLHSFSSLNSNNLLFGCPYNLLKGMDASDMNLITSDECWDEEKLFGKTPTECDETSL